MAKTFIGVQGEVQTVIQTNKTGSVLIATFPTTQVVAVDAGGSATPSILNRKVDSERIVKEFEVMLNYEMFLETSGSVKFIGDDGDTCGVLLLL